MKTIDETTHRDLEFVEHAWILDKFAMQIRSDLSIKVTMVMEDHTDISAGPNYSVLIQDVKVYDMEDNPIGHVRHKYDAGSRRGPSFHEITEDMKSEFDPIIVMTQKMMGMKLTGTNAALGLVNALRKLGITSFGEMEEAYKEGIDNGSDRDTGE